MDREQVLEPAPDRDIESESSGMSSSTAAIIERMTRSLDYVTQLEEAGKITEADLRMNVCR